MHVGGKVTFDNGNCATAVFTTKHTLKVTDTPAIKPSFFTINPAQQNVKVAGTNGTRGYFGGFGNVTGSYPVTTQNAGLEGNGGAVTGNCASGVTGIVWSQSTNPGTSEQIGL